MSYAEMAAALQQGNSGVLSAGAALALWRDCTDRGVTAWCYEFGFPESLTYTVTIVEIDRSLQVHDPFFNVSYPIGLYDMLASLRDGRPVIGKRAARDRKIYIMDPAVEPEATVRWLEAKADREFEPVNQLRRFEIVWDAEGFTATQPATDAALCTLAARGYPADLQFLMLHPVSVFDGACHHRDRASMPLVGGRDLESPAAALRVTIRDLEAERAQGIEKIAAISRLEAELAEANAQLTTARVEAERTFAAEREAWLQQKVALQAGRGALEGELAKTRSQLAAAIDLRAQRDSQIAQLRAEIEDATRQLDRQQKALVALQGERQKWDAERLRRDSENQDLLRRLETGRCKIDQLCRRVLLAESEAAAAAEHAIDLTHYIAPLLKEADRLRRDHEAEVSLLQSRITEAAMRTAGMAADIAVSATPSPAAALWRRFATRWRLPSRTGRAGGRNNAMPGAPRN